MPLSFNAQRVEQNGSLIFDLLVTNDHGSPIVRKSVKIEAPVSLASIKARLEEVLATEPIALLQQAIDEMNRR